MKPGLAALATLVLLSAVPPARASIQPLHWYRMGDALASDPAPQPVPDAGTSALTLHDCIGGSELAAVNLAGTVNGKTAIAESNTGISSQRSLDLPASGSGYVGAPLTTDTGDFEFEGWLTLSSSTGTRNMCIACNGTPGVNGWSIYLQQIGQQGTLVVRSGPTTVASVLLGSTPSTQSYYFALLHSRSLGDKLMINNLSYTVARSIMTAPTGQFTLGVAPDGFGGYKDAYTGNLDEIRFSLLQTGTSSLDEELLNPAPDIQAVISFNKGSSANLYQSSEVDLGTYGLGVLDLIDVGLLTSFRGPLGPSVPALRISSVTLGGPDAAEFQQIPATFPSVQTYVSFYFKPLTTGSKTATITVISNDPEDSPLIITLHAAVVSAAKIGVFTGASPESGQPYYTFLPSAAVASATPGSTGEKTYFSVLNTGLSDLHLSPATLAGNDADSFIISQQPAATVAPGESTAFAVSFTPAGGGTHQASVILNSDAANYPVFRLPVIATASGPVLKLSGPDGISLDSHAILTWGSNPINDIDGITAMLGSVKALTGGDHFRAAIRADNTVAVWGDNGKVLDVPAGLGSVTRLAASSSSLVALKSDGTLTAWGNEPNILDIPADLTGVTAIAAGDGYALALKSDGTVSGWGFSFTPGAAIPPGLSGVTAISASASHAIALKNDGTVVDWGDSDIVAPTALNQVVAIESLANGGLALRADGSMVSWNGKTAAGSPFLSGGSPFTALGGGDQAATAIRADGTVALASSTNLSGMLTEPRFPHQALDIRNRDNQMAELYDSYVDLSAEDPQHTGIPQIFTVTNSGASDLHLTSAGISGSAADDYLLDSSEMATILAPGGTTTLTVALAPGASGKESATLEVASDDPGHPIFTVRVAGQPQINVGPYDAWKAQYFPSGGADASDLADPNGNGIPNLLEYALGGNPLTAAAASVLPKYAPDSSGNLSFSVPMYSLKTDVNITVQGSDTLNDGDWVDLATSSGGSNFQILVTGLTWSREITSDSTGYVYYFQPSATVALTAPHQYMRVKVSTR